ncbi:hypothetical protein GSI_04688 [Ganoderma sinense ZZ0214-1]|uniref:Protein kinase domain-containing protein n=1 Tax=Ganoderma sinense ZZ0214-1 TaxID=1077348 RepID=A0A2G8SI48_9APHY|nr:hypothetical protein GSI_04688 [Ganoderma sinense ZZ0214-1]
MENSKPWWPSSGAALARHFGLAPQLGGYSATKAWSTPSSISSSCSSSTSSPSPTSPGPTSSASLTTFVGLNRRLEAPSSPGTHSRYFPSLVQHSSSISEESSNSNSSPIPTPIKLPWYFPSSKPPVAKKDIIEAFLGQPNVCTPSRLSGLGLGLASRPLSPPSMAPQPKRLLNPSPFIVPLPALSRPSSACSSWSSGSERSVPGTPLSFPGFGGSAVWSPHAPYTSQWPSATEIAASFGLQYKSRVGTTCDNALGLLDAEQNSCDVPLSSAYPGPPPGLPPPSRLVASHGLDLPSLGPCLPDVDFEDFEDVGEVTTITRRAAEIVHAGMSFKVTSTLGVGASARVFGADHAGKRYAVKVIHKTAAAASGFTRGEYLHELEVFRRISQAPETHEFLSTLKMSWEDVLQDRICFVMDLYPTDLFSVLSEGAPITATDRQLYCKELISAVSALRDLGIVHGDIKPSNVLIDARGRAVLSDFGNAEDASSCPDGYEFWKSHVMSGTPPYMAPEVASIGVQEHGYGASADVWSLGLVFLEIFGQFAGAYFDVWTVEDVRVQHAKLDRQGIDLQKVPRFEMPGCLEIMLDAMLQYYEELRPTVEELAEWSACPMNWEISPDATHDWVPMSESCWDVGESNLADFLSFGDSANVAPSGEENPADFEYRALEAFA